MKLQIESKADNNDDVDSWELAENGKRKLLS